MTAEHGPYRKVKARTERFVRDLLDPANPHRPLILPHNFVGEVIVAFKEDFKKKKEEDRKAAEKKLKTQQGETPPSGFPEEIPEWDR